MEKLWRAEGQKNTNRSSCINHVMFYVERINLNCVLLNYVHSYTLFNRYTVWGTRSLFTTKFLLFHSCLTLLKDSFSPSSKVFLWLPQGLLPSTLGFCMLPSPSSHKTFTPHSQTTTAGCPHCYLWLFLYTGWLLQCFFLIWSLLVFH